MEQQQTKNLTTAARAKLQREASIAAHEKLPEQEQETIDNFVEVLIEDINPRGGKCGPLTMLEILGALGMFLERGCGDPDY